MTRSARFLLPMLRKALARLPGAALQQKTVAVDLTAYPPVVSNGIDTPTVHCWLRALADAQPQWRWLLLTSASSHEAFADLESSHMRRRCIALARPEMRVPWTLQAANTNRLHQIWKSMVRMAGLPRPPVMRSTETLLRGLQVDLLFCPFAVVNCNDWTVPTVALWNDLTHLLCPQFLAPALQTATERAFKQSLHVAERLVCFSTPARSEILKASRTDERRVLAVTLQPLVRWPHPSRSDMTAVLNRYGLVSSSYFLYPARFTESNNHKLLLVSFGIFRARHPHDDLHLVCAAPDTDPPAGLVQAARLMGLRASTVFVAPASTDEQAALLQGCRAVLFPTLEGSQASVLFQAVEGSKPILCSNLGHMPAAARDAALLFDPKKPTEVVQALERAAFDGQLLNTLVHRSHRQAKLLGGPHEAARQMIEVFQEAMTTSRRFAYGIRGIYPDGWTSERIVVTFPAAPRGRTVRLTLRSATWLPWSYQRVKSLLTGHTAGKLHKLKRGQTLTVERQLPPEAGCLEFLVDPPIIPQALGLSDDDRLLGCVCAECTITGPAVNLRLHPPAAAA